MKIPNFEQTSEVLKFINVFLKTFIDSVETKNNQVICQSKIKTEITIEDINKTAFDVSTSLVLTISCSNCDSINSGLSGLLTVSKFKLSIADTTSMAAAPSKRYLGSNSSICFINNLI